MSDPIKDLEEFPTMPTAPLPAQEVRRRGDRLRRRRRALSTVGSVAAVALIVTGGYAATQLGGSDRDNGDERVATQIPSHQDLTYGRLTKANAMSDADTVLPSGDSWPAGTVNEGDGGQSAINSCQRSTIKGLGPDQIYIGSWNAEALYLTQAVTQFPDAAAASAAADDVRQWLADCTPPVSTGYASTDPVEVDAIDGVRAELVTSRWTYTGEEGGESYAEHEMNTAILVSGNRMSMITLESPTDVEGSTDALAAMVVSAAGRLIVEAGTSDDDSEPLWATEIPDSLPLAHGYPAANGDGSPVEMTGETGVEEFTLCATPAWTTEGSIDLRGVRFTGQGEDVRGRTLVLYPTDDAARQAVERARTALRDCPEESVDDGVSFSVHDQIDSSRGDSNVVYATRYRTADQGFDPGLTVHQFIQVGNAVLVTMEYGEGGAQADEMVQRQDDEAEEIVDAMRAFFGAAANPTLTGTGHGPLVLGDPVDRAAVELIDGQLPEAGCTQATFGFPPDKEVRAAVSSRLGVAVIFLGNDDTTPEGISLGSTRDDVMAAYPDAEYSEVHNALTVAPPGHDDRHWEFFLDAEDVVTQADLQLNDQDCVG